MWEEWTPFHYTLKVSKKFSLGIHLNLVWVSSQEKKKKKILECVEDIKPTFIVSY